MLTVIWSKTNLCGGNIADKGGLYRDQKAVLKEFSALLAQRPVWTTAALKERVSGFTDVEFEWMLPRIAYMFRNGMARPNSRCASHTFSSMKRCQMAELP